MALEVTIHKITSWYDANKVLWEGKATSTKDAVEQAVASGANLSGANLSDAKLSGAKLSGAKLSGANLSGAKLSGANLSYANLSYAKLSYAKLSDANLSYANLSDANLSDAKLSYANLSGAKLSYANLSGDLRLPTGETWIEYLTETVPALLTAGGKSLDSFGSHFLCHDWENCPMAHAFDVHREQDIPILFRPRASQFIQLFDAKQIPWPLPTKAEMEGGKQ